MNPMKMRKKGLYTSRIYTETELTTGAQAPFFLIKTAFLEVFKKFFVWQTSIFMEFRHVLQKFFKKISILLKRRLRYSRGKVFFFRLIPRCSALRIPAARFEYRRAKRRHRNRRRSGCRPSRRGGLRGGSFPLRVARLRCRRFR